MAKESKKFNYGLYAVATFVAVTAVLVIITAFTFKAKYMAFYPDRVAVNYTDSIMQNGDGYNAYKYTLASKSAKYGDFIRQQYMYPLIYPNYTPGDEVTDEMKKNGLSADKRKSDATLKDDGTLSGKLADTMYPVYAGLMQNGGWDDYDTVYKTYFAKLIEVRKEIFGDEYMSDEVMFTALEANVKVYGNSLTGTEQELAPDEKTVIQEKTTGLYQTKFGEDYKITSTVANSKAVEDLDAYKAALDAAKLETYGITADDISAAEQVEVQCALEDGTVIVNQTVYTVKIGSTWYVDNLTTNTSAVYAIEV